jgi:4-hydroxybenzoate polyprenyltransferase
MQLHKIKYLFLLIALSALLYILIYFGGNFVFEDSRSLIGVAAAVLMFILFELFVILNSDRKNKPEKKRQSINLILGYKTARILLSIVFLSIYAMAVKLEIKRFVVVFLVLYLIFLLFDTVYLLKRERILKIKN